MNVLQLIMSLVSVYETGFVLRREEVPPIKLN